MAIKADGKGVLSKLEEIHVYHVKRLVAGFQASPTKIARKLGDPVYCARFGFDPVEIKPPNITKLIATFTDLDIAVLRAEYLCDFGDLPLSYTKERVRELSDLYESIDSMKSPVTVDGKRKNLPDAQKLLHKLRVLRQISEEMDEGIEALAAAIRDSRQPLSSRLNREQMLEISSVLAEEAARIEVGRIEESGFERKG